MKNITKSFKGQTVLDGIDFVVEEGDRIGIVGQNGVGKTTLLNILCGEDFDHDPKNGESDRFIKKDISIGYLNQVERLTCGNTLYEEIRQSFAKVDKAADEIAQLTKQLTVAKQGSSEYKSISDKLNTLNSYFESIDGFQIDTKIKKVLYGMGFADKDINDVVDKLSGGEKTRFALARLLCQEPDLLVLDEPTNHLDFDTRDWLEKYLSTFKGAIVTVSHDRYFLDKVVNKVTEIRQGKLYSYVGGYQQFSVLRQADLDLQQKQFEKQQGEIAKMEEFVRKNLAASSSTNSVGSRVKALEKMRRVEKTPPPQKDLPLHFDFAENPVKDVLTVKKFSLTLGQKVLLDNVFFSVNRGDKIALVGKNGAGKTSFLRAILRKIPFVGAVSWGGGTKIGYFAQENQNLNLSKSVYDEVCDRMPLATQFDVRSLLARVNIVGEDCLKQIGELSGATRSKVQFALLMRERANVLILDEPTNHLDFKALEGLDKALREFEGTLILVTHDRYLLQKVPTKIAEIHNGQITLYQGNYDAYTSAKQREAAKDTQKQQAELSFEQVNDTKKIAINKKQARVDKAQKNLLEKEIAAIEEDLQKLNQELLLPQNMCDYKKCAEIQQAIEKADAQLTAAMEKWLSLSE